MNPKQSNSEIEPEKPSNKKKGIKRFIVPSIGEGNWVKRSRRLVVRLLFWYLVVVVLIAVFQRKLIYHPTVTSSRLFAVEARLMKGTLHDIAIETHDGLTLNGWHFLPAPHKAESKEKCDQVLEKSPWLILYFHGNGANRFLRRHDAGVFTRNEANVFLFDYRGYGDNPGSPTEAHLLKDARSVWDYATQQRNVPPNKIVIYGESLGGGVAVQLAADVCEEGSPPAGLILSGTFSSAVDVAAHRFPFIPVRWVMVDRFESIDRTKSITCPVAQIHGELDHIVPFKFGKKLFESFPEQSSNGIEKQILELPSVRHNNIPTDPMRDFVRKFFREIEATR